ncbi:DUF1360 domain-containing protein [Bacillaceae bacterium Marseille-Q3522]|nr:DUF1360 domain-containing protein [Bacillaceae bacterium Marseille-Q3522]
MEIPFLHFVILTLASFRLTRLMVYDKITEFIRAPFFDELEEVDEKSGEKEIYYIPKDRPVLHFFGELLSCYWCTGMWSAIILSILYLLFPDYIFPVLLILAVAGLAAIAETIVQQWMNGRE